MQESDEDIFRSLVPFSEDQKMVEMRRIACFAGDARIKEYTAQPAWQGGKLKKLGSISSKRLTAGK